MRRLLFTIVLLFFATAALPQKVQLGAYYLPQITSISNSISDKDDRIYENKLTFAGGGGLNLTYRFNSSGIQTGLLYVSHNQKFISEYFVNRRANSVATYEGKKRLDYLKVPLLFTYTYSPPSKKPSTVSFTTFAGPQLGYLLKADGAVMIYQHGPDSDFYDLPPASNSYYKKFIVDLVLGWGLNFRLNNHLAINTAIRADWSISDVENKGATTYDNQLSTYYFGDPDRKKSHNASLGLLLGINYTFGKDHLLSPSSKWN